MQIFGSENKVKIGKHVETQDALLNTVCGNIYLSDYVFFGHGVKILTGSHDTKTTKLERQNSWERYQDNDIVLGESVWVGSGAIVLGPCSIGKNSVVAAGSVVLPGDYPENVLIAGNPAKIKKNIDIKQDS